MQIFSKLVKSSIILSKNQFNFKPMVEAAPEPKKTKYQELNELVD